MSLSKEWRDKGNVQLQTCTAVGIAPVVKQNRLTKVMACYENALQYARSDSDRASAFKNIATTFKKTSEIHIHQIDMKEYASTYNKFFINCALALKFGRKSKPYRWLSSMKSMVQSNYEVAVNAILDLDGYAARAKLLEVLFTNVEVGFISIDMIGDRLYKIADSYFKEALVGMEQKDFKKTLHILKETYFPIEEMKKITRRKSFNVTATTSDTFEYVENLKSEINVLNEDILNLNSNAESAQAIATGDDLLRVAVMEQESPNIALVLDVLDWYHKAIILARNLEVETEAIASSRIGKVYDEVLKIRHKAREWFKNSLDLAHSLAPRNFNKEAWYCLARDRKNKFQEETQIADDAKKEEEKKKHLKKYEKEMKQLDDLVHTYLKSEKNRFLIEVYNNFPPKKSEIKIPSIEEFRNMEFSAVKKVFQKACVHYHPDSQDEKKHGLGWKYFCQEIVKYFTQCYESMK